MYVSATISLLCSRRTSSSAALSGVPGIRRETTDALLALGGFELPGIQSRTRVKQTV